LSIEWVQASAYIAAILSAQGYASEGSMTGSLKGAASTGIGQIVGMRAIRGPGFQICGGKADSVQVTSSEVSNSLLAGQELRLASISLLHVQCEVVCDTAANIVRNAKVKVAVRHPND
jgi:hypothetical protein